MPEAPFVLIDQRGEVRRMRDGQPFRYSTTELAARAKAIFERQRGNTATYHVARSGRPRQA